MKFKRVRGGTWYDDAGDAHCAFRNKGMPEGRYYGVGFRCCFSPLFINDKRKVRNESKI